MNEQDCFARIKIRCPYCYTEFNEEELGDREIVVKTYYTNVSDFKFKVNCPKCGNEFFYQNVSEPLFTTTRIKDGNEIIEWEEKN